MILQIILGLAVLGEGYIIWNLTRKTERLETWIEDYAQRVIDTQVKEKFTKSTDPKDIFNELFGEKK